MQWFPISSLSFPNPWGLFLVCQLSLVSSSSSCSTAFSALWKIQVFVYLFDYYYQYYYYFPPFEFFPPLFNDDHSLEFKWQQVSSSLQDSSQYLFSHYHWIFRQDLERKVVIMYIMFIYSGGGVHSLDAFFFFIHIHSTLLRIGVTFEFHISWDNLVFFLHVSFLFLIITRTFTIIGTVVFLKGKFFFSFSFQIFIFTYYSY